MKTKSWMKLSFIAFIPFIYLFLFYGSLGMSYWFGCNGIKDFIAGKVNEPFVAICSFVAFICLYIFMWTAMKLFPHADEIESLAESKDEYEKAKYNYEEKLKELSDKFLNQ